MNELGLTGSVAVSGLQFDGMSSIVCLTKKLLRRVAFSTAEDTVRWETGSMRIEHGSFLVFPVSWRINVQKSRDDSVEEETRVLRWRLVA